jgi:hypothetical protein
MQQRRPVSRPVPVPKSQQHHQRASEVAAAAESKDAVPATATADATTAALAPTATAVAASPTQQQQQQQPAAAAQGASAAASSGGSSNHPQHHGGAGYPRYADQSTTGQAVDLVTHMEVYSGIHDAIYTIPRADVVTADGVEDPTRSSIPHQHSKNLQLCPAFEPFAVAAAAARRAALEAGDEAAAAAVPAPVCPNAGRCKNLHALLDHATSHDIHVNYAWACLDDCQYERFPAGELLPVAPPNAALPVDEIPSQLVLKTRALASNRRVISHCAHYYFNRTCNRGSACFFIHAVSLMTRDPSNLTDDVPHSLRRLWGRAAQRRVLSNAAHAASGSSTPPAVGGATAAATGAGASAASSPVPTTATSMSPAPAGGAPPMSRLASAMATPAHSHPVSRTDSTVMAHQRFGAGSPAPFPDAPMVPLVQVGRPAAMSPTFPHHGAGAASNGYGQQQQQHNGYGVAHYHHPHAYMGVMLPHGAAMPPQPQHTYAGSVAVGAPAMHFPAMSQVHSGSQQNMFQSYVSTDADGAARTPASSASSLDGSINNAVAPLASAANAGCFPQPGAWPSNPPTPMRRVNNPYSMTMPVVRSYPSSPITAVA